MINCFELFYLIHSNVDLAILYNICNINIITINNE